jgi:GTPase SAR1 family protein
MLKNKSEKNISVSTGNSSSRSAEKQMYMAKVIILGNSSVGKTSILTRYTWNGQGSYHLSHTPTIGVDFKTKIIDLKVANMKLMLWDTAGQ